jgi:dTDP-glucose 4,6-dehydratase
MKKTILITGVCGFIFSNFIRNVASLDQFRFVGVDKLVKTFNIDNMFEHPNYKFYMADIADQHAMERIFQIEKPDIVIGGAAESFVDNSITDIMPFLHTNVIGTQVLINACLKFGVEKYIHISTDEVYGQQLNKDDIAWTEKAALNPRNPYAASKAAAELIVKTAHETHGLQYQMTRSCNVYGPRQKFDNLIPMIINNMKNNLPIKIHGNGTNFRQYIYVNDKIEAIMKILENGEINQTYNIGDYNYFSNLEMVSKVANVLGKKDFKIEFIADRKAHDFGYSVANAKLQYIGWSPKTKFDEGINKTINFYKAQL